LPQVLIRWSNLPVDSSTWEDYYMVKRYPNAAVSVQTVSEGLCVWVGGMFRAERWTSEADEE
jgi:hypothetical protein